ncbi:MAG: hypothetical protein ACR2QV_11825, partial [Gammaproteobacteria bacterium]
ENPSNVHFMRHRVHEGMVEEVMPKPNYSFLEFNRWKQLLNESALVRYLYLNLRIKLLLKNLSREKARYAANIDLGVLEQRKTEVETITRYILERIRQENPDRRIIVVMDADRNGIYAGEANGQIMYLHRLMNKLSESIGFELIDLTAPMKKAYAANGKKFNSDFDGHWDEYGHEFVYRQVSALLLDRSQRASFATTDEVSAVDR